MTKDEIKSYQRAYRHKHRDKLAAYNKIYRLNHKEKGAIYQKAYQQSHRDELAAYQRTYQRKYLLEHRKQRIEWSKRHQKKYPLECATRALLGRAVCAGKIEKPKLCSVCGTTGRIEGHHEDYEKPLEVIWLCPMCHRGIHK